MNFTPSQWQGKKVAFIGDSITDSSHIGTSKNYWQFLAESLGIIPLVYGHSGQRWEHAARELDLLMREHGTEVDAIFIFLGTNDYNNSIPLGEWYALRLENTNDNGIVMPKPRRIINVEPGTLCGWINGAMSRIREVYPLAQVVLMTPLHRAFACFSPENVQQDESFPNRLGLYFDSYIRIIREAADIWSCPLIDLYRDGGLHPLTPSHGIFFHNGKTDRLHLNEKGHERIAALMAYRMLSLPPSFR